VRELVFANDIATAIPSRTGDFTISGVWEKAAPGPLTAPQPSISAAGRKLFEALENSRNALFREVEKVEDELRSVRLDHAGALEAVYGLCAERADARTEIDLLSKELASALQTVHVREAEQALLRERGDELVVELETIGARLVELETARTDLVRELEATRAASTRELDAMLATSTRELETMRATSAREMEATRAASARELEATRVELEQVEAELARVKQQVMDLAPFANRAGRTQAAILRLLRRAHLLGG
jgi:chromosome segregation ATPase